ncbi:MAG: hypothetical protein SFV15_01070 [Polyangiaceae bacterium]|nr:hypothetical protein [Polyangiaceae bacterium]
MNGAEGAVFDALALVGFAKVDITGSAAWNEADGWYGKLDSALKPRPASYVFELFNRLALGSVVGATTEDAQAIVPLGVMSKSGKSLFLVNRTTGNLTLELQGFDDRNTEASQVTQAGMAQVVLPTTGQVVLPAFRTFSPSIPERGLNALPMHFSPFGWAETVSFSKEAR